MSKRSGDQIETATKKQKTRDSNELVNRVRQFDREAVLSLQEQQLNRTTLQRLLSELIEVYWEDVPPTLLSLSDDILYLILKYLDSVTCLSMRRVCRRFYHLAKHIACHTQVVRAPPLSWVVSMYPACTQFELHECEPDTAFYQALSQSRCTHLCIQNSYRFTSGLKVLSNVRLHKITCLEIRGRRGYCACRVLRGNNSYIHVNLPAVRKLIFTALPACNHISRCRLLTFTRKVLPKLELLALGDIQKTSVYDPCDAHLDRIFHEDWRAEQLHTLQLYQSCKEIKLCHLLSLLPTHAPCLRRLEIRIRLENLFCVNLLSTTAVSPSALLEQLVGCTQLERLVTHARAYWEKIEVVYLESVLRQLPLSFCSLWKIELYASSSSAHRPEKRSLAYSNTLLPLLAKYGIQSNFSLLPNLSAAY